MGDTIKFKKGLKENLPTLGIGEPGFTTNVDDQRMYIGGPNGNVAIPNMEDIDTINSQMNDLTQNMDNKQDVNYQQIADGTDLNNLKAFNKRYCTINNLNARSCINIPRTNVLSFELYMPQTSPVENETYYYSQILAEWNGNIWTRFYNEAKWSNWVLIGGEQKSLDSGWIDITLTVGNLVSSDFKPQYRKIGNEVIVRGRFTNLTEVGIFATLPIGYRPTRGMAFIAPMQGASYAKCVVFSNGDLKIDTPSSTITSSQYFILDHVRFTID